MKLGLGLGVNSITSQKVGEGFTGILDEYSGAVVAYSSNRLSSLYSFTKVVRAVVSKRLSLPNPISSSALSLDLLVRNIVDE